MTGTLPADCLEGAFEALLRGVVDAIPSPGALPAALDRLLGFAGVDLAGADAGERARLAERGVERLAPLLDSAGLTRHAPAKAVGPPPFEVLRRALANRPSGRDEAGRAFDAFLLASTPVSALRARRVFLEREIQFRMRVGAKDRPFQVLALGAGPDADLSSLLRLAADEGVEVRVTLVDEDPAALAAARAAAGKLGSKRRVRTLCADPARLTATARRRRPRDQDFIYGTCLLDFLDDGAAARCLEEAFEALAPGGELVMAHYHQDLTAAQRFVLEWWLRWRPCFRSPRAIARLWGDTKIPAAGRTVGLVRGPNVYLVAQRS